MSRAWDATAYHEVSDPHVAWANVLLDRLELRGDETVLDAGCGSGRVTAMLVERLPGGRVVAVDADEAMVEHAGRTLAGMPVELRRADLTELQLDEPVDAVFSSAVFHWIADHERLFGRLAAALRPGGRLVAQCGGEGNIARLHAAAREVGAAPPYEEHLGGWTGPWNFAGPVETRERLEAAGFTAVETWLEPWPVTPGDPEAYLRTVCLGPHLARLPEELAGTFVRAVRERAGDELDYVRLNIVASRS